MSRRPSRARVEALLRRLSLEDLELLQRRLPSIIATVREDQEGVTSWTFSEVLVRDGRSDVPRGPYWYATRRRHGKTERRYLGAGVSVDIAGRVWIQRRATATKAACWVSIDENGSLVEQARMPKSSLPIAPG